MMQPVTAQSPRVCRIPGLCFWSRRVQGSSPCSCSLTLSPFSHTVKVSSPARLGRRANASLIRAPVGLEMTAPSMYVDPGEGGCRTPCSAGSRPAIAPGTFGGATMSLNTSCLVGALVGILEALAGEVCLSREGSGNVHAWKFALPLLLAPCSVGRPAVGLPSPRTRTIGLAHQCWPFPLSSVASFLLFPNMGRLVPHMFVCTFAGLTVGTSRLEKVMSTRTCLYLSWGAKMRHV
ncbi:hypothetical protein HDV57DRAFT_432850 [Trichoderma longibrachiatum]